MSTEPRTLMEAVRYFADLDVAQAAMVELRWPSGVCCPTCGRTDVRYIATRRMWECKEKHPRKQFSAKVGTIFEDSPLGLDKWFVAVWAVANCKNGISSYELARHIGVTQKSAWHMLHRIRLAMQIGSIDKMDGEVEADETFVGGKAANMHKHRRAKLVKGTGVSGRAVVIGILERGAEGRTSRVRAKVIHNVHRATIEAEVRENVTPGAALYTDSYTGYAKLGDEYKHETVNHAIEYVRGRVHTNGAENFWSLLKRSIKGTYVSVEPFHLGRYVDEQVFRFNERVRTDLGRFKLVLSRVAGRRLTYKDLTTNEHFASA